MLFVDHFFERFGIRLGNEAYSAIPFDQLFDWITAEGQAFPEQLYSWSGEYEWLTSRGDVVWDDEDKCERSCDGFELVEDWNAGITRFLNEHSSRKESPEL